MNGSGFDWLNSYQKGNGTQSPLAPSVSFGGGDQVNHQSQSLSPLQQHQVQSHQAQAPPHQSQHQFTHQEQPQQLEPHQTQLSHLALPEFMFKNASAEQLNQQPLSSRTFLNNYNDHFPHKTNSADNLGINTVSEDYLSIPLSLTAQELTLQESKTYMRWYLDILARTNSRTITMQDVFQFLNNFRIPFAIRDKIQRIFQKIAYLINIGEFFALLRLISHTLNGLEPQRLLIKLEAPVPTPPSILSKKRQNEDEVSTPEIEEDTDSQLDIDGFTQFILTGERPNEIPKKKRSKKLKLVKFSDQLVTDEEYRMRAEEVDYTSLTMDELLKLRGSGNDRLPDEQEHEFDEPELLQPNMTGPVQIAQLHGDIPDLAPLRPNVTGPADMARLFVPDQFNQQMLQESLDTPKISLQSFTSQMTGNTQENTIQNSRATNNDGNRPLPPPPVPNTRRSRSVSSPSPRINSPSFGMDSPALPPRSAGSPLGSRAPSNSLSSALPNGAFSPSGTLSPTRTFSPNGSFTNGVLNANGLRVPPPPPPLRRRNASLTGQAPPLPPKVMVNSPYGNSNDSTTNILDDLKALQEEVDKIRDMTGGF